MVLAVSTTAAPRPPYLTQAKPLYGDSIAVGDGRVYTYRGDWILAVFDYDRINGDANVKRVPYTVCRIIGAARKCATRVWRRHPDIWMTRVPANVGAARYVDFTWATGGKRRGSSRIWIYE